MQVQIKFIASGANSAYGAFTSGDKLRCSPEMAKFLVDEGLARFVNQDDAVQGASVAPVVAEQRKAKVRKSK
jgi:hypothetical protein